MPDKCAPCPCGSGKKHKFCCFKPKARSEATREARLAKEAEAAKIAAQLRAALAATRYRPIGTKESDHA